MSEQSRTTLKTKFERGDKPTESDFVDFIDSGFNKTDDNSDNITEGTNKFVTQAQKDKLDAIEAGATGDQTGAEIKAAYEAQSDTNAFTDAKSSKLDAIETGATADQTDAEIKVLAGFKAVSIPSGFSYTPSFNIYRTPKGFVTDFDITSLEPTPDTTYYLSPSGDDANDGLTVGNPKKDIRDLITALNGTSAGTVAFILASGTYPADLTWSGVSPDFNLVLKCTSGRAILTTELPSGETPSWSQNGTYTNTYGFTRGTGNPEPLYDKTNLNKYGRPKAFIRASSHSDCNSTANSYYRNGDTIYVHTHDTRQPDSSVIIGLSTIETAEFDNGGTLYCENIDFWGGAGDTDHSLQIDSAATTYAYFKNCTFAYSLQGNGFRTDLADPSIMISVDCEAFENFNDGFNYHARGGAGHKYIEINCRGFNNGYESPNDNGSTSHDGCVGIRINGFYADNGNRNIHDINDDTEAWLLGCVAKNSQNSANVHDSFNFGFGRNGQTDSTTAWLDECISEGGSESDLNVYPSSSVKIKKFEATGGIFTNTGTLEVYD